MAFDADRFTETSKASWTEVAPRYAKLSERHFAEATAAFLRFSALKPGEKVLDLACGPGTATLDAAKTVGTKGRVVGADLSAGMLAVARRRAQEKGLDIDWVETRADALAFETGAFDAVICQLGLMLFARPDEALREMTRVARAAGRVACMVQGRRENNLFTSMVMSAVIRRAPHLKEEGAPNVFAFGPEGALEDAFARAGLRHAESRRIEGTLPFPSAQAYWDQMTQASGRTGAMLRSLPAQTQREVRSEVLERAAGFAAASGVAIPYEMVMARATKA